MKGEREPRRRSRSRPRRSARPPPRRRRTGRRSQASRRGAMGARREPASSFKCAPSRGARLVELPRIERERNDRAAGRRRGWHEMATVTGTGLAGRNDGRGVAAFAGAATERACGRGAPLDPGAGAAAVTKSRRMAYDEPDWLSGPASCRRSPRPVRVSRDPYDGALQALRASPRQCSRPAATRPQAHRALFAGEPGYATPKIDVRAAVFDAASAS